MQAIFKWITVNQNFAEINIQPVKMLAHLEILIWKPQMQNWTKKGNGLTMECSECLSHF